MDIADTGELLDALAGIARHGTYGGGFPCQRCQLPRLSLSGQDPAHWWPLWEPPAASVSEDDGESIICLRCRHETRRGDAVRLAIEDPKALERLVRSAQKAVSPED